MHSQKWRSSVRFALVLVVCLTPAVSSSQSPPSAWTVTDVGEPGLPGAASYSGTTFIVSGAGADIGTTSDQFVFVHRALTGDGSIIANVTSLQAANQWAKAGVMMRESLDSGSRHALALVTDGRGTGFHRRTVTGGATSTTSDAGDIPQWLKLERRGNSFTASRSADGVTWSSIGSQSVDMVATIRVGLAVSSRKASEPALGTFSSVSVVGPGDAPSVSLTSPQSGATFTAPAVLTLAASASDADGVVARVDFFHDSVLIGSDATAPYTLSWSNVPVGSYSLTAAARDDNGATTVSGTTSVLVVDSNMPGSVAFVPSANHATAVDGYVLEVFHAGADPSVSNPVLTVDLGKPAVVSGECLVDVSRAISKLAPGTYISTVTAVGSGGSARSSSSPPFTR